MSSTAQPSTPEPFKLEMANERIMWWMEPCVQELVAKFDYVYLCKQPRVQMLWPMHLAAPDHTNA